MSWARDITVGLIAGVIVTILAEALRRKLVKRRMRPADEHRRILFPFVGRAISYGALDAAIRLADAEQATLVPSYLARVPMRLSLAASLPREGDSAVDLLEAIEQRAGRAGVPADSRIVRGRTAQHALQTLTETENYYRIVLPAASGTEDGLDASAIAWALDHAPGEIVVLRPGHEAPAHRRVPRWDHRTRRNRGAGGAKKSAA